MNTPMNILSGRDQVSRDESRDTYWTRLWFKSQDDQRETSIFICASHEYLGTVFRTDAFDSAILNRWADSEVIEWRTKGEQIFETTQHFEVKAVTDEGHQKGLTFLVTCVAPAIEHRI
jgi:hypothetical protein